MASFDKNQSNGLKAAMFERKKGDGTLEYAFVYAGTDDQPDVENDLSQVIDLSSQYNQTEKLAEEISEYLSYAEVTFVGHSLGGGLSNLSSLVTGRSSITFNPAWLSRFTIDKSRKLRAGATRRNFVHERDPLGMIQRNVGWSVGLKNVGTDFKVDGGWNPLKNNTFFGHLIGTMIDRMEKNRQTRQHKENGSDVIIIGKSPRDY